MLIPVCDIYGVPQSIQYIYKDLEGQMQFTFLEETKTEKCFFQAKPLNDPEKIFVCKDVITAVSLSKILEMDKTRALEKCFVVAAFSAKEIPRICMLMHAGYEYTEVIAACDNEEDKESIDIENVYNQSEEESSLNQSEESQEHKEQSPEQEHQEQSQDTEKTDILAIRKTGVGTMFPPKEFKNWSDVYIHQKEESLKTFLNTFRLYRHYFSTEAFSQKRQPLKSKEDPCKFCMEDFPYDIRKYLEHLIGPQHASSSCRRILVTTSFMCSVSSILRKKVFFAKKSDGKSMYFQKLYTNVWSLVVAKSGAGKSSALKSGMEIAIERQEEAEEKISQLKFQNNITPATRESQIPLDIRRQIYELDLEDPLVPESITTEALLLYLSEERGGMIECSEFSVWLSSMEKTYNGDLKSTLTKFFDVDIPTFRRRTKTQGELKIKKPYLCVNGASTIDWLKKQTEKEDILSGFFARFLLFDPVEEEEKDIWTPLENSEGNEEAMACKKRIKKVLENIREKEFLFDKESKELHASFCDSYRSYWKRLEEGKIKKMLDPYVRRWASYLLKFAMIFSIFEDPFKRTLSCKSLRAAHALVLCAVKSSINLFSNELGESIQQEKQRLVMDYIKKKSFQGESVPYYKICKSKILEGGSMEYQSILETLSDSRLIVVENAKDKKKNWVIKLFPEQL